MGAGASVETHEQTIQLQPSSELDEGSQSHTYIHTHIHTYM